MTSVGTGYDLSATTFSPDGRVFQVEYAYKAVENSGTAVAVRVKDGIVFGVEKLIRSKMLVEGSNRRLHSIGTHIGLASAGFQADARQLVNRAREETQSYFNYYSHKIPVRVLNERLSGFVQAYTLYGYVRPFGCSILIGGIDENGPQLYMIEPSGLSWGYYGCAVGKSAAAAKTEIEKLKLNELTCEQVVVDIAKIIYALHDDVKDKEFELELSWISTTQSSSKHELVPKHIKENAERLAKAALDDMDD